MRIEATPGGSPSTRCGDRGTGDRTTGGGGGRAADRRPDVAGYAGAVIDWLAARGLGPVVLAGHSSGTQVAAQGRRDVGRWPRARWLRDGPREPRGLTASVWPQWWRAGPRRPAYLVNPHRRCDIEPALLRTQAIHPDRATSPPCGTAVTSG